MASKRLRAAKPSTSKKNQPPAPRIFDRPASPPPKRPAVQILDDPPPATR